MKALRTTKAKCSVKAKPPKNSCRSRKILSCSLYTRPLRVRSARGACGDGGKLASCPLAKKARAVRNPASERLFLQQRPPIIFARTRELITSTAHVTHRGKIYLKFSSHMPMDACGFKGGREKKKSIFKSCTNNNDGQVALPPLFLFFSKVQPIPLLFLPLLSPSGGAGRLCIFSISFWRENCTKSVLYT